MKKIILLLGFLSLSVFAVDFDQYDLTEIQIKLLKKWEAKGFSEEKLKLFAEKFERENIKRRNQRDVYIPEHTKQDIDDVFEWARGAAFVSYAKYVGATFDVERYNNDCPNLALFNFSRATGTKYIKRDLILGTINLSYGLNVYFQRDKTENKEVFQEEYLELIKKEGFYHYLIF